MKYDVIVIGAGLSGLSCASLLSKSKLKTCVIESCYKPGGSCGTFKKNGCVFEQGAAMLYGFGESGFNSHRFLFNCLKEPIDIIKHENLYCINYEGKKIIFYEDIDKFVEQLSEVFPSEKDNLKHFYSDMLNLYNNVMVDTPVYSTPDSVDKSQALKQFSKHPLIYTKFLSFLNISTETLLKRYFKSADIFKFFDKLTSTYCYTTVSETPAILSAIMFINNHVGGSFYPAGSTLLLSGKLEKVIEENGGTMMYNSTVQQILLNCGKAWGVKLQNGESIFADNIVYSGTIWNLYGQLLKGKEFDSKLKWANSIQPTYSSSVLYAMVKDSVIPEGTQPIEMLVSDASKIDESEITVYILSLDDKTLCPKGYHTITAIGPSFQKWPCGLESYSKDKAYMVQKEYEKERMLSVIEKRFPGFRDAIVYSTLATPSTLERYTRKNFGAVAGPKQCLGQHMLKRPSIKSDIPGLYLCGESTTMGTGTPTVTVSGISAANLILKEHSMKQYTYDPHATDFVTIVKTPYTGYQTKYGSVEQAIKNEADKCSYCEDASCMSNDDCKINIRDILRRCACYNFIGAKNICSGNLDKCADCVEKYCESACKSFSSNKPIQIQATLSALNLLNIER